MPYLRAVFAMNVASECVELSSTPATFMLKPVLNISGSTASEPGSIGKDESSPLTRSWLAVLSSHTMSVWQAYTRIGLTSFDEPELTRMNGRAQFYPGGQHYLAWWSGKFASANFAICSRGFSRQATTKPICGYRIAFNPATSRPMPSCAVSVRSAPYDTRRQHASVMPNVSPGST